MAKTGKSIPRGRQDKPRNSKQPLILILVGIVFLMLVAFFTFQKTATSYTPQVTGRPNLTVDKEKVDLGDVKLGNKVQVSYELKNTGDQPLKMIRAPYIEVKEGC